MTQSVTQGMTLASRQSMPDLTISSLFLMAKLIKFVSSRMRYGGPSAVLYLKKSDDGTCGLQGQQQQQQQQQQGRAVRVGGR